MTPGTADGGRRKADRDEVADGERHTTPDSLAGGTEPAPGLEARRAKPGVPGATDRSASPDVRTAVDKTAVEEEGEEEEGEEEDGKDEDGEDEDGEDEDGKDEEEEEDGPVVDAEKEEGAEEEGAEEEGTEEEGAEEESKDGGGAAAASGGEPDVAEDASADPETSGGAGASAGASAGGAGVAISSSPSGEGGDPRSALTAFAPVVRGEISLEANGIDPTTLPPESADLVKDVFGGIRDQNADLADAFLGDRQSEAASLVGMADVIEQQLTTAASQASEAVRASVASQKALVSQAFASAVAQAQTQAAAAHAQIDGQLSATFAAIAADTASAKAGLLGDMTGALAGIAAAKAAQRAAVEAQYQTAEQKYQQVGKEVGQDAIAKGEDRFHTFTDGVKNEDDSLLDGPLTYNRAQASGNAARGVAKAYQEALEEKANELAKEAGENKATDLEKVEEVAKSATTQVEQHYQALLGQITQTSIASNSSASAAAASLHSAASAALTSTSASLNEQESAQRSNLDAIGEQACSEISSQADHAISGLSDGLFTALTELDQALHLIRDSFGTPEVPDPSVFAASLGEAGATFQENLTASADSIRGGLSAAVEALHATASATTSKLSETAVQGVAVAGQVAAQSAQQFGALRASAQSSFTALAAGHRQGTQAITQSGRTGFSAVVDGLTGAYTEMSTQFAAGLERNVAGLRTGLESAFPEMESKITTEADAAAAKVKPRWKSVLKWVCIIAVIVVVAFVIGPFILGAAGALLGTGTLAATIAGGAVVGMVSSAATTLVSNAFDGNPLTQGLVTAILIGGVTGGIGAGIGFVATQGGTVAISFVKELALNVTVDVVLDTTISAITGNLSWEGFATTLISSVVMTSAGHIPVIKNITTHFQTKGADFGNYLKGGSGGSGSTAGTTPKLDNEPSIKVDDPNVKVDDPNVKVDDPSIKVDDPSIKVDDPNLKAAGSNSETDAPTAKGPTGKSEAKANNYPDPPDGYHWSLDKSGEPYIRRNPGTVKKGNPQIQFDPKTGTFVDAKTGQVFPTAADVNTHIEVKNTEHGKRPDPSTYLSEGQIKNHHDKFKDGASFIGAKDPSASDIKNSISAEDGTKFVVPTAEAYRILAEAGNDIRKIEKALTLKSGYFKNKDVVVVDIPNPESLNLRIPSGNEAGAKGKNWLPGGKTGGGANEAVVDRIPPDQYTETVVIPAPPK